jgi:translation initiation factor IF-2
MLLTKLYIININIIKRCKDPFILFYNKSNRLFIIIEDRLELTKL